MAIDAMARWRLLREIITKNKTGTLTVRSGRNYQHWLLRKGVVFQVVSTSEEHSLARFLREEQIINDIALQMGRAQVDDQYSLGFVLVLKGFASQETVVKALERHRVHLAQSLLQSGTHLSWSDRLMEPKEFTLDAPQSLAQILLQIERSFLELQPAVRCVEESGSRLRAIHAANAQPWLSKRELAVLEYLKSDCTFETILRDPDLDRFTCYRTIFLLWVSGHLRVQADSPVMAPVKASVSVLQRLRSVPPEWVIPFLIGMLVGGLVVPRSESNERETGNVKPAARWQMTQKPAWATPSEPNTGSE